MIRHYPELVLKTNEAGFVREDATATPRSCQELPPDCSCAQRSARKDPKTLPAHASAFLNLTWIWT